MPATTQHKKPKRLASVPNIRDLEIHADEQFAYIREHLIQDGLINELTTAKQLAILFGQMMHFHEEVFGAHAPDTFKHRMFKIPARLFKDFRRDGSVYEMLKVMHSSRDKKLEFTPARREANVEMMVQIRDTLLNRQFMKTKLFYFDDRSFVASGQQQQLAALRARLQQLPAREAQEVTSHAASTHSIEADPEHLKEPEGDQDASDDFLRTLEVRGDLALVHWWYYPDSYDQWIAQSAVSGDSEPPAAEKPHWRLHARYMRDSILFNEWMNEVDYDLEDLLDEDAQQTPQPEAMTAEKRPSGKTTERGRKKKGGKTAKKAKKSTSYAAEATEDGSDAVMSDAAAPAPSPVPMHFQQDNTQIEITASQTSQATASAGTKRSADQISNGDGCAAPTQEQDQAQPASKRPRTDGTTPTTELLHQQQHSSTPLSNVQTPTPVPQTSRPQLPPVIIPAHASWFKFEEIHDIEKNAFPDFFDGKNPNRTPDVYKLVRNFMINTFRSSPATYLSATSCRKVLTGDISSIMRIHSFLEHWGLINHMIDPRNRPQSFVQQMASIPPGTGTVVLDYTREPQTVLEKLVQFPGQQQRQKTHQQQAAQQMQQANAAVQQQATQSASAQGWTEEETLALLDMLSKYGDKWDLIAQQLKNKTKEQCMLHFLQMPIEDQFLNAANFGHSTTEADVTPSEPPLPFADSSNPVMLMIGFLASMVSPGVAAAATEAAQKALEDELRQKDGSSPQQPGQVDMSKLDVKTMANATIGAAAARAKQLADREEIEIMSLVALVVEKQIKKIELKMRHFEQLEQLIQKERQDLESSKKQLAEERANLRLTMSALAAGSQQPAANGHLNPSDGGFPGASTHQMYV